MRLASKAALLLSPDLRAVARDVREARDLAREAQDRLRVKGGMVPTELPEAVEHLEAALGALEGRPPNRG